MASKTKKPPSTLRALCKYPDRMGTEVVLPLGPGMVRRFMTSVGISRSRIKRELKTIFYFGQPTKVRGLSFSPVEPRKFNGK